MKGHRFEGIWKLYIISVRCTRCTSCVSRHVYKTKDQFVDAVPGLALVDLKGPRLDIVKIHLPSFRAIFQDVSGMSIVSAVGNHNDCHGSHNL